MLVQTVGKAILGPPFLSVIMARGSLEVSLYEAVSSAAIGLVLSRRLYHQVWQLFETFLVSPLRPEASAGNLNLLLAPSRHWFVVICPEETLCQSSGPAPYARCRDHPIDVCSSRSESPLRSSSHSLAHSLHPSLPSPLLSFIQSIGCSRAPGRRHVSE
jgi:hypothetical protein